MNNTAKFLMFFGFWMALIANGADKLSAQSKGKASQIKLDNPTEQVIRKEITPGGIVKLIDATTDYKEGVSDWKGNVLPDYQNLLFNRIRFGYATDAASGKEAELSYNSDLPPALLNSRFVIKQGGRTVVNLPISRLTNNFVETTLDDFYADLGVIRYLVDSTPVDMYIEFADGATIAGTDKHYVYVGLEGFSTKLG